MNKKAEDRDDVENVAGDNPRDIYDHIYGKCQDSLLFLIIFKPLLTRRDRA
jgi:hypothetical protein